MFVGFEGFEVFEMFKKVVQKLESYKVCEFIFV